jgi:cell division protein FtsW
MARKLKSDKLLFIATLLLVCTSVVMVYSASMGLAIDPRDPRPLSVHLFKQAAWVLIGLSLLPIVMKIDYRTYRQPVFIWTLLTIVLVTLTIVLFGNPINGATRWLNLGPLGMQPSELAKLAVIAFTAALLERRMDRIDDVGYSLGPLGLMLGAVVALVLLEPDLGTAVAIVTIAAAMVFAAGLSYSYIGGLVLAAVPALYALLITQPYRMKRLAAFLRPEDDPLGAGYQLIQSSIAVGSGGLTGRGLMNGGQKLGFLPEPHNDFIYAVIAEELGLLGATVVLACFCVIAWRGLRCAVRAPDRFGAFVAIGLTTMIAFQAFFNISVVLGLVPTKGIPLPFVSAGGSSLFINLVGLGVLLNISQHASTSHVVTTAMATADA